MRRRIYEVLEVGSTDDKPSRCYDFFMLSMIMISIFPLAFKTQYQVFSVIDKITMVVFIVDYVLRIITADHFLKKGKLSFLLMPFTPMALIDLISILPSLLVVNQSLKLLKIFRLFRSLRVFRILKVVRYSKSIKMLIRIYKKSREPLLTVCGIAISYVLISALVILNVEPETFNNYFDAVYWATVSLTTVGYGDIYPVSTAGKVITMISSVFGIAIIALPASIITTGMMEEINHKDKNL